MKSYKTTEKPVIASEELRVRIEELINTEKPVIASETKQVSEQSETPI